MINREPSRLPPAQVARAFGSKSSGSVNLESRILKNPILAKEEPSFELPWLLKHGKVCVCLYVRGGQGSSFYIFLDNALEQPKSRKFLFRVASHLRQTGKLDISSLRYVCGLPLSR